MCGRFTLRTNASVLSRLFQVVIQRFTPRFNLAPSQQVKAIVSDKCGIFQETELRWGLIPDWSRNERSKPPLLINARSESVSEKPSFRDALRHRPCLVLADGFYEWLKTDSGKNPMRIQLKNGSPFAFAGLWDNGLDINGRAISTCTILTTASTTFMQPIHHRMPVILKRENEARWIDPKINSPSDIQSLIVQNPDTYLQSWQVSNLVNSPLNNDPKCLEAVI